MIFDIVIFTVSSVILVTAIGTFIILLALWAYTDAKAKASLHPVIWALVVVLGLFPIGLIIYLLIGRTNKKEPRTNKYKKTVIIAFLLIFPSFFFHNVGVFRLSTADQREGFFLNTGQFYELQQSVGEQTWTISAERAYGFVERNFSLSQSDLENLTSSLEIFEGGVALGITQIKNNEAESFVISDEPTTRIETTSIEPGIVRKTVYFHNAIDVNLVISWRAINSDK